MVSFRLRASADARKHGHMLRGKEMRRGFMHRNSARMGTLTTQYVRRKHLLARRNPRKQEERPDDKVANRAKPTTTADNVDGSEQPAMSGARVEEMLRLLGEEEGGNS